MYRRILRREPNHPDALHLLGVLARQSGDPEAAIELVSRAVAAKPQAAQYRNTLGDAALATGRVAAAVAEFGRAVELRPDFTLAWYNLGLALQQQGELTAASEAYRRALELDPNLAEAHAFLGLVLAWQGQLRAAIGSYRRALALQPENAEVWCNLGAALRAEGMLPEALESLERAVRLRPEDAEARCLLGSVRMEAGDFELAERELRRAAELDPANAEAHNLLGNVLELLVRAHEARACYQRASELAPDRPEGHCNLGRVLQAGGDVAGAERRYREALTLRADYAPAWQNLVVLARGELSDDELERLEKLAARPEVAPNELAALSFALGHVHERRRDYATAFRWFERANRLKRERVHFDAPAHEAHVGRVIDVFSTELFRTRGAHGDGAELPVFIVGMPRAGTTLVEQILAQHPRVRGGGELNFLRQARAAIERCVAPSTPYPECLGSLSVDSLRGVAAEYRDRLRALGPDADRITDKMPQNFLDLGLVRLLFPRARIIHCRRDPLDTCVSIYRLAFAGGHGYAYDLADLGRYYRQYQRLMQHWRAVLDPALLEVQYEDLVAEPEAVSRRLVEYLGLAWDDRCLAFTTDPRPVLTASSAQVRQPIYRDAVGRWEHYREHLGPLLAALDG